MFKLYCIINSLSNSYYIGITSSSIERRLYEHINNSKLGKVTKLYDAIRSYGAENFTIYLLDEFDSREDCLNSEIYTINLCKINNIPIYNMTKGGEGGFVVPEDKIDQWKEKLSIARKGGKPALGMKHSEENKRLFSEVSNKYWDENRKYEAKDIQACVSLKDAQAKYGISKTHYYRLRKRALPNE